jgi:hypothetical protein
MAPMRIHFHGASLPSASTLSVTGLAAPRDAIGHSNQRAHGTALDALQDHPDAPADRAGLLGDGRHHRLSVRRKALSEPVERQPIAHREGRNGGSRAMSATHSASPRRCPEPADRRGVERPNPNGVANRRIVGVDEQRQARVIAVLGVAREMNFTHRLKRKIGEIAIRVEAVIDQTQLANSKIHVPTIMMTGHGDIRCPSGR